MDILLMIVCSMAAAALLVYVIFRAHAVIGTVLEYRRALEAVKRYRTAAVRPRHRLEIEQDGGTVCIESGAAAKTQSVPSEGR